MKRLEWLVLVKCGRENCNRYLEFDHFGLSVEDHSDNSLSPRILRLISLVLSVWLWGPACFSHLALSFQTLVILAILKLLLFPMFLGFHSLLSPCICICLLLPPPTSHTTFILGAGTEVWAQDYRLAK
jgi:hypothetical protein